MATPVAAATGGAVNSRSRYWLVPVARAAVAAVAAVVITFNGNHSPWLGLSVFGGFAVLTALIEIVLGSARLAADRVSRRTFFAQAIITLAAGVVALALAPNSSLPAFYAIVIVWALLTGALELYSGFRLRRRSPLARDWTTIGGLTVLLAVAFLLVPPGLDHQFTGPDGIDRSLTASIVTVGIFGAYAAIGAVLLVIGGFSLKWGTDESGRVPPETEARP
ncbi:peptidoglycan/LPS O-acetylase OafA/YrhL [Mycetocola sp. CAN_C7]|uniref:DUF308 domain-containing protein n=1 Tax=Mycetocola sp. CAN_C7 TaxID=2787724 RepID=UPI0018CB2F44